MGELSTGSGRYVLVLLLLLAGIASGQTTGVRPLALPDSGSADPAVTAMQKSLEQQQTALDAFRDTIQTTSLLQQRESVVKQVEPLQANTGQVPTAASTTTPSPPAVSMTGSMKFFSVPWPGSLPLSMPNVQVAADSCEALGKAEIDKLVQSAAGKHGLSSDLLRSVMKQESAFKPCALSTAGAMGLMQIMPETAGMLHLEDPFDPAGNVDAGAKFLKMMLDRFGGDLPLALAAYNAGPGAVDKAGRIPPIAETLQYLTNILGDLPVAY